MVELNISNGKGFTMFSLGAISGLAVWVLLLVGAVIGGFIFGGQRSWKELFK